MQKPVNQSCLRNQEPIFQTLQGFFKAPGNVLELACGTAQHAVYLAQRLPHLDWQPSDLPHSLEGANQWIKEANLNNLKPALKLNAAQKKWPITQYDYVYCANLLHFVSQQDVNNIFTNIGDHLSNGGLLAVYGPFNQEGFTSEGNRSLNQWLQNEVNPEAGIKELDTITDLAKKHGLNLLENASMPANNHLLLFKQTNNL